MSRFDSLNKVMLLGNLGADPDLTHTKSGTPVCRINIATSRNIKKGDQWEELTDWHRVVIFGNDAENASKYLFKGSKVFVEGRLQTRSYEDRDGNRRYTTEVVENKIVFLDSKKSSSSNSDERGGGRTYQQPSKNDSSPDKSSGTDSYDVKDDDDDLPF